MMQLSTWSPTPRRLVPPPLWLVSDGTSTVGPVNMGRLVTGVVRGYVDTDHWVRDVNAKRWRGVGEVREVRALRQQPSRQLGVLEALLRLTDDTREALRLGLEIAMLKTGATAGLAHCFEDPMKAPVTRWVAGLGQANQLGAPLPEGDALARVARARCVAVGEPQSDRAFAAAAQRLGATSQEVRGVAMVPVIHPRGIVGMLELGRSGHPFRAQDAIVLREVARAATPK